jgi:hypothetical protein
VLELSVQSVTVTSLMQALTRIGIGRVQRPNRPRVHQQVGQTDMMAPLLGPPLAVRMVSMYMPGGICVEELGRRNCMKGGGGRNREARGAGMRVLLQGGVRHRAGRSRRENLVS